jgi:hypothetical protein
MDQVRVSTSTDGRYVPDVGDVVDVIIKGATVNIVGVEPGNPDAYYSTIVIDDGTRTYGAISGVFPAPGVTITPATEDVAEAPHGRWVATLSGPDGTVYPDLATLSRHVAWPEIAVVRGSAAPTDGRMPGDYQHTDVLYSKSGLDISDPEDAAREWARAQAVAGAINAGPSQPPATQHFSARDLRALADAIDSGEDIPDLNIHVIINPYTVDPDSQEAAVRRIAQAVGLKTLVVSDGRKTTSEARGDYHGLSVRITGSQHLGGESR